MKFSLGDQVRFLNETGEGVVTRIINKSMVGVTIEEGFELPYSVQELVLVNAALPAEKMEEKKQPVQTSKKDKRKEGIYTALSPEYKDNMAQTAFNLWLINHTAYEIMYSCSRSREDRLELFDKGEAHPFTSRIVATISRAALDDFANVQFDILFFNTTKYDHRPPLSEVIKIKQARLYKENAFAENEFIPEKALILNVSLTEKQLFFDTPEGKNADLSNLLFQKKSGAGEARVSKPHMRNNPEYEMEIDLHIEELIDHYERMSNAEIVQLQLRHFQQALDKAINEHYRKLTVIHGVGNGRLKQEVRAILSASGLRFYDASYARYGFGATEVLFG